MSLILSAKSSSQSNGLSRSRRSHFSRKDSSTEIAGSQTNRQKTDTASAENNNTERSMVQKVGYFL